MMREIERKWLVKAQAIPEAVDGEDIDQGYLADGPNVEVRIRIADGAATLTIKAGKGLERLELEKPLSEPEFWGLWPHTAGRQIRKRRLKISLGDLTAEVDIYQGVHHGLVVVEVEFKTLDEAAKFEPPNWFGAEVTGDPAYANRALAAAQTSPHAPS